jgi:MFS family permease
VGGMEGEWLSETLSRVRRSRQLSTVLAVQTVAQMVAKFGFSALLDHFSVRAVLLAALVTQLLALGVFAAALVLVWQPLAVAGVGLQAAALGGAYSVDGAWQQTTVTLVQHCRV